MSLHLNQSNVSLGNKAFGPLLANLQANILKGHGRNFAHHLFIQFKTETIAQAKKWMSDFAKTTVTTAYKQLDDTAKRDKDVANKVAHPHDGGTLITLSLSNYAYRTLHIKSSITKDNVFNNGMQARVDKLLDKFENWEDEFKKPQLDMLIIVADDDATVAANRANDIIQQINPFAKCIKNQRGNVLKMAETGVGIEHFGYADGISQPLYLDNEINSQNAKVWNDKTNLDMVLVKEADGADNCYGSYFVFRKLEQNVMAFKIAEGDANPNPAHPEMKRLLPSVLLQSGEEDEESELSGAMIVGRFENSVPVTKFSEAGTVNPTNDNLDNDFDYADDTACLKCPFHSHIRLVNPRKGNPKQDPAEIRSHRITRRGITFDDGNPKRIADNEILSITADMLDDNQPTEKVGLLFMCYQNNIETHFEELQAQWANTGIIDPAKESIGEDSIITQGDDLPRTLPVQWGKPTQSKPFQFSNFVTMRGGEYFYTPSLHFLKTLA